MFMCFIVFLCVCLQFFADIYVFLFALILPFQTGTGRRRSWNEKKNTKSACDNFTLYISIIYKRLKLKIVVEFFHLVIDV